MNKIHCSHCQSLNIEFLESSRRPNNICNLWECYDCGKLFKTFESKQNRQGFGLLSAIFGALIMTITMFAMFSLLKLVAVYSGKMTRLLDRLNAEPIAVVCGGSAPCEGTPAICMTSHGNDSTLACTVASPCQFVAGQWSRQNIQCDAGMIFKRKL